MHTSSKPNVPASLAKGLTLHRQGRIEAARKYYLRILDTQTDHPDVLHLLGLVEYDAVNVDRAIDLIQSAIKADPKRADFFLSLGRAFEKKGRSNQAIASFKKALAIDPAMSRASLNLATQYLNCGRTGDAVHCLQQAVNTVPDCVDAHLMIGQVHLDRGHLDAAIRRFDSAWRIAPHRHDLCFYLGIAHHKSGDTQASLDWYEKAIQRRRGFAEAYLNMGLVHAQIGDLESAASCYRMALESMPDMPEALNNMGNLEMHKGRLIQANAWYEQAVARHPLFKAARLNLANCYRQRRLYRDALACYRQLIDHDPAMDSAHMGMGAVYKDRRQHKKAIACFLKVLELNPASTAACDNLAIVFNDLGLSEKARAFLDRKARFHTDFADAIKRAMMLPIIYDSVSHIDACRQAFKTDLKQLQTQGSTIADPYRQVGITNFILALHGKDERPIREQIARFYVEICPDLHWISPYMNTRQSGKRIKIGMVSKFFYNNTIGSLYHGLIQQLSKDKFSLILFRLPGQEDDLSLTMHVAADEVVYLPPDIKRARERIARARLDVLFYPELGMDALTYFIAFSRLAPVQCKRGFQITMGLPTIDYFISSDAAEPSDAQRYYTEMLVRLKGTGYYYHRPPMPEQIPDRKTFGLPEERRLYICPQSLFKLHPDFDPVLAALLERDPEGVIVLLEGLHPQWKTLVLDRLAKTISDVDKRICFIPRQSRQEFLNLYLLADAVIDTIHFSGGHTSLECFAWGIPVVTWPSERLPGRLTYGFYKLMGVMDCVAWDQTSYVKIACRLAGDHEWRRAVSRKIVNRSGVLFQNTDDVRELEQFFENAVKASYHGSQA